MAKRILPLRPQLPEPDLTPPEPAGGDDLELVARMARDVAARYLLDCVNIFAGVAFNKNSQASPHTRVIAASYLCQIAAPGAIRLPSLTTPQANSEAAALEQV